DTNITVQRVFSQQLHRLFTFMNETQTDIKKDNLTKLTNMTGTIKLQNIHYHYPEQKQHIIQYLNLTIQAGERIAIVGPSGQGKSTLIKMISRFYDPIEGRILLDGIDYKDLSLSQVRESIGQVFQETYLFAASIKDNIRFGRPDATDEE